MLAGVKKVKFHTHYDEMICHFRLQLKVKVLWATLPSKFGIGHAVLVQLFFREKPKGQVSLH
jgi:hypothetical protein